MPSIILPPLSPTTFTNPKTEKDYQRLDYCALISSFDLNGFYKLLVASYIVSLDFVIN